MAATKRKPPVKAPPKPSVVAVVLTYLWANPRAVLVVCALLLTYYAGYTRGHADYLYQCGYQAGFVAANTMEVSR